MQEAYKSIRDLTEQLRQEQDSRDHQRKCFEAELDKVHSSLKQHEFRLKLKEETWKKLLDKLCN